MLLPRNKERWDSIWIATNTALSALLYLFSFFATISALVTYYNYAYRCPDAPLNSKIVRHDSVCRAIRSNHKLHSLFSEIWACVALLTVAHITYPFVFWVTLDPRQRPFRLAYFMPLIQLYQLLHLFSHTHRLQEFQKSYKESRSLYSVLGASLETAPQVVIQYLVIVRLEEYIMGSSNPNLQAQRIPINLMISLVASLASCGYNTGMAVVLLMDSKNMRISSIICVGLVAGFHAIASMLGKAMIVGLYSAQFSSHGMPVTCLLYITIGVMVPWVLIGLFMAQHHSSEGWCLRIVHSFALALVTRLIGPIYVTLKLGMSPCLLILNIVLHIFVELVAIAMLYLLQKKQFPCLLRQIIGSEEERNKLLTCKAFLGTISSSFFFLILTTFLLVWLLTKSDTIVRCASTTSMDNFRNMSDKVVSETKLLQFIDNHTWKSSKIKGADEKELKNFFKIFLFVISFFLNKRSRAMYALKYQERNFSL